MKNLRETEAWFNDSRAVCEGLTLDSSPDHTTLWLDNGEPAVYSMHVYHPEIQSVSKTADPEQRQRNGWFDLVHCAEHWGLDIAVMPVSWYNAFSTVNIVFYLP